LLAAGEIGPLGADQGVHALGQLLQNVPALGGHQRREHLLPGGVGAGSPDIFKDGCFEQAAVLEHKGDLIHEHMGIDLPYIHAAHFHRTGGGVPEAGDQAGGGGLAAAGGPHQSHGLPRLRCEGDMGEGGCLRAVVSKAHILKFHTAVLRFLRMVRIFQFRSAHDLVDAAQGGAGQHHARCGEHDLGKGCGDDGGEHCVKGKVCDKSCEVAAGQGTRRQEQGRRNQEHKGALGEGQVDGLGDPADLGLKIFGFVTIILDGLLERLEGIDGLLEDLDHRDATDILGACLGHTVLGRLVFRHQLGVVAAHHGEHGHNGDHRSQQAGRAHPPVKDEHHHQHGDEQRDGAHDVRQVVGQQGLRVGRRRVQPPADEAGGVGIEEAQRGLHHMGHTLLADVGGRAEGSQMGTHQSRKIQDDAGHRKGERQPAVLGDALRLRPVRRHRDQVPGCQPDADVGCHAQQHGHRRQGQAQKGQALVVACVVQQDGHITLFLLLHEKTSFSKLA